MFPGIIDKSEKHIQSLEARIAELEAIVALPQNELQARLDSSERSLKKVMPQLREYVLNCAVKLATGLLKYQKIFIIFANVFPEILPKDFEFWVRKGYYQSGDGDPDEAISILHRKILTKSLTIFQFNLDPVKFPNSASTGKQAQFAQLPHYMFVDSLGQCFTGNQLLSTIKFVDFEGNSAGNWHTKDFKDMDKYHEVEKATVGIADLRVGDATEMDLRVADATAAAPAPQGAGQGGAGKDEKDMKSPT